MWRRCWRKAKEEQTLSGRGWDGGGDHDAPSGQRIIAAVRPKAVGNYRCRVGCRHCRKTMVPFRRFIPNSRQWCGILFHLPGDSRLLRVCWVAYCLTVFLAGVAVAYFALEPRTVGRRQACWTASGTVETDIWVSVWHDVGVHRIDQFTGVAFWRGEQGLDPRGYVPPLQPGQPPQTWWYRASGYQSGSLLSSVNHGSVCGMSWRSGTDWTKRVGNTVWSSKSGWVMNIALWPPLCLLLLPGLVVLLRRLARHARGQWRMAMNRCPQCGYNLCATPHQCPECGTPAQNPAWWSV